MYMDDIKLFSKNEKELETLIQVVIIYRDDIGMEFGIEKRDMLIMRSGKRQMMEGIEIPNQEKIRTFEENENCKYLGILGADTFKQAKIREKSVSQENKKTS